MPRIATQSMSACDPEGFRGLRPTAAGCRTLHTLLLPPNQDPACDLPFVSIRQVDRRAGAREARRWIAPSPESASTHFDSYPITAQMGVLVFSSNLRAGSPPGTKIAFRRRKLVTRPLTQTLLAHVRTPRCANDATFNEIGIAAADDFGILPAIGLDLSRAVASRYNADEYFVIPGAIWLRPGKLTERWRAEVVRRPRKTPGKILHANSQLSMAA